MQIFRKKRFYLSILLTVGALIASFMFKVYSEPTEILSQVVSATRQELKTDADGRTNILLFGLDKRIDSNSPEEGMLTDSIMLVSVDKQAGTYTMFSFPRDIWITNDLKTNINYVGKINSAYETQGIEGFIDVVESLSGKQIHYYLGISFSGFIDGINALDGIEVEVENTFDDYMYPLEGKENDLCGIDLSVVEESDNKFKEQAVCLESGNCIVFETLVDFESEINNIKKDLEDKFVDDNKDLEKDPDKFNKELDKYINENLTKGLDQKYLYNDKSYEIKAEELEFVCRYEHLHFDKGIQTMGGEMALKYARSRHAFGVEGSDFARAKRQQNVIDAVKKKALSLSTLANPIKLKELYGAYSKNVETNVNIVDAQLIFESLSALNNINSKVLTSGDVYSDGGILKGFYGDEEYDFSFVLLPNNGDYKIFSEFIAQTLKNANLNEEDNLR